MNNRIESLIKQLCLEPHPEGGFFAPCYRSDQIIDARLLPNGNWKGYRNLYSSIYFMLQSGQHSAWHRLASDEIWHFYEGDPLTLHIINQDGVYFGILLGLKNEHICYQWLVKGGSWMAATTEGHCGYSLIGCTLAPGFDFEDFEFASEETLRKTYPALTSEMIKLLHNG